MDAGDWAPFADVVVATVVVVVVVAAAAAAAVVAAVAAVVDGGGGVVSYYGVSENHTISVPDHVNSKCSPAQCRAIHRLRSYCRRACPN